MACNWIKKSVLKSKEKRTESFPGNLAMALYKDNKMLVMSDDTVVDVDVDVDLILLDRLVDSPCCCCCCCCVSSAITIQIDAHLNACEVNSFTKSRKN